MVKFTTSIVAATLLSVPVLAAASQEYEREVAESDLYGRDFPEDDVELLTREDLEDIFGRDFVEELEEREPLVMDSTCSNMASITSMATVDLEDNIATTTSVASAPAAILANSNSNHPDVSLEKIPKNSTLENSSMTLKSVNLLASACHGFHMLKHGFNHFHGHGGSGGQHHHHHLGGFSSGGDPSQQQQQPSRRDLEELEEREPLGFGMVSSVKL
ncbi:hypothetical protein CPB84DRAFT_1843724 [Gymnopilus junonius]|uniref:Uncharacterized protein n=1 Tax=Gymnopilus junonius TaxID=109634 RepID=A0A9P5NXI7_GYMJU|nr:hypothetical protein CPB84DRAFT_1843724 [Gymnopilus junonius]